MSFTTTGERTATIAWSLSPRHAGASGVTALRPTTIPVGAAVTVAAGLRELGADEFDKLIRLFLRDGAARIVGLRAAQRTNDASAMLKLAHSLKGSASSFGAGTLAARCGELHARATPADAAENARLIDRVDAEFVRARAALLKELEPVQPAS